MPSRAHQRIVRSEEANGWKIGGCGFCSGFGTTPTCRTMLSSSNPAPYSRVASMSHGVPSGGICQASPLYSIISSVQHLRMMLKCSSKAARLAASIASCWPGRAPWTPWICCASVSTQRRW